MCNDRHKQVLRLYCPIPPFKSTREYKEARFEPSFLFALLLIGLHEIPQISLILSGFV